MKNRLLSALFLMLCLYGSAQNLNPKYNKALADSMGGDNFGMKTYVLVILKTGTNTTEKKAAVDSLFRGHMSNIEQMAQGGKLVVAGPMQKNEKNYRGIFILNVKTFEEASALMVNDPAISSKLLDVEMFHWYGSAALPIYLPYHEKLQKVKM
ncbi:MAG: hypothetical protein H7Y27_08005 [Gemmatimonadaceae bacterium]|nr:hypothetical protein [Chitinophagaceae bacterium]